MPCSGPDIYVASGELSPLRACDRSGGPRRWGSRRPRPGPAWAAPPAPAGRPGGPRSAPGRGRCPPCGRRSASASARCPPGAWRRRCPPETPACGPGRSCRPGARDSWPRRRTGPGTARPPGRQPGPGQARSCPYSNRAGCRPPGRRSRPLPWTGTGGRPGRLPGPGCRWRDNFPGMPGPRPGGCPRRRRSRRGTAHGAARPAARRRSRCPWPALRSPAGRRNAPAARSRW